MANRDTTSTPYNTSADGVCYFAYSDGNAPVITVTNYAVLRTKGSADAGYSSSLTLTDPYMAGSFKFSSTDPYGGGDDGGIVIAATNGWWVRRLVNNLHFDWFESVVQDADVTNLFKRFGTYAYSFPASNRFVIASPTKCTQCTLTSKVTLSRNYFRLTAQQPFTFLIIGTFGCTIQVTNFIEGEFAAGVTLKGRDEDEQRTPDNIAVSQHALYIVPTISSVFFKFYGIVHTPRHGAVGVEGMNNTNDFTFYLGGEMWNGGFGVGGVGNINRVILDNGMVYDPKGRVCGLDINDPYSTPDHARAKRFAGGGVLVKNWSGKFGSRWGGTLPTPFLVQPGIESFGTEANPVVFDIHDFWHTDTGVKAGPPTWFFQHKSDGGNPINGQRLYFRFVFHGTCKPVGYEAEATPEGTPGWVYKSNRYTIEFVDESINGCWGGFTNGAVEDMVRQDDSVPGSYWSTQYFIPDSTDPPTTHSKGESKDHVVKGKMIGVSCIETGLTVKNAYFPVRPAGENPWAQIGVSRCSLQRWTRPDNLLVEDCVFEQSPQWPPWNPASDASGQHDGQITIAAGQNLVFRRCTFLGAARKIFNIIPGCYYGGTQADRDKMYGAGPHPITKSYEPEHEQIILILENITAPAGSILNVEQRVGPQGNMWAPLSRITITRDGVPITTFPYTF